MSPRTPAAVVVRIPGLLRSYTDGAATVALASAAARRRRSPTRWPRSTAASPGLRFRIVDEQGTLRPHIKLFVDGALGARSRDAAAAGAELMIVGALSGG